MSLAKSLLVIDDSPTMRNLIVMTLKRLGPFNIVQAENGQDGLDKLSAESFDLVLTDIDMPVMTGLDFIRYARAKMPQLPIIVLSTHGEDTMRDKGLALGANNYLTKPLKSNDLVDVLEGIFPELEM